MEMSPAQGIIIFIALCVVIVAIAFLRWRRYKLLVSWLEKTGITTSARITKIKMAPKWQQRIFSISWYNLRYEFELPNGTKISHNLYSEEIYEEILISYFHRASRNQMNDVKEGNLLEIIYDPKKPKRNHPKSLLPMLIQRLSSQ